MRSECATVWCDCHLGDRAPGRSCLKYGGPTHSHYLLIRFLSLILHLIERRIFSFTLPPTMSASDHDPHRGRVDRTPDPTNGTIGGLRPQHLDKNRYPKNFLFARANQYQRGQVDEYVPSPQVNTNNGAPVADNTMNSSDLAPQYASRSSSRAREHSPHPQRHTYHSTSEIDNNMNAFYSPSQLQTNTSPYQMQSNNQHAQYSFSNPYEHAPYRQNTAGYHMPQLPQRHDSLTSSLQNNASNLHQQALDGIRSTPELQHQRSGVPLHSHNSTVNHRPYLQGPSSSTSEPQYIYPRSITPSRNNSIEHELHTSNAQSGYVPNVQGSLDTHMPQSQRHYESRSAIPSPGDAVGNVQQNNTTEHTPQFLDNPVKRPYHQQGCATHPKVSQLSRGPTLQDNFLSDGPRAQTNLLGNGAKMQSSAIGLAPHTHWGTPSSALWSPNGFVSHGSEAVGDVSMHPPLPQKRFLDPAFAQLRQGYSGTYGETTLGKKARLDDTASGTPTNRSYFNQQNDGKPASAPQVMVRKVDRTLSLSVTTVRRVRDAAYSITHPPFRAFSNSSVTRQWVRELKDFTANRLVRAQSPLHFFGYERLNMTETMWKAITEHDRSRRPAYPLRIEDRQIVRCDEKHSLVDHSPPGFVSVACVECPPEKIDHCDGATKQAHMMCAACIREHDTAFADQNQSKLAALVRGAAWANLCNHCMANCYSHEETCTCEWEVPRCLKHRRKHLEQLIGRWECSIIKDVDVCALCFEKPATDRIATAWRCQVCLGILFMAGGVASTWLPSGPPLPDGFQVCDELKFENLMD